MRLGRKDPRNTRRRTSQQRTGQEQDMMTSADWLLAAHGQQNPCRRLTSLLLRFSLGGAKASQHVGERVVPLVTRVLVNRLGRSCHRQLAFPRQAERAWVVDLERVEQRVRV